jgi:DNA polymerase-3 subunit epsilon
MRQIFLDTETTGLNPEAGDRVIEIGCVEMVKRRLTGNNLHLYLNPQRASHDDALRVHGLTEAFLADKPLFSQVVDQFLDYVRDAEIIIHNANFDVGFLNEELRRLDRPKFPTYAAQVTDSLTLARELFPGKSNSLDALCRRLEVDNTNRTLHGALLDAGLLAEVYIRMTRGQDSLVHVDTPQDGATYTLEAIDFSQLNLPLLAATAEETQAHALLLKELDKSSGGKTLWRNLDACPPP